MKKLLPVTILAQANEENGGLIKFPSGREIILGKTDAAALIPVPEMCEEGDHPVGSDGDKCFACFVYNNKELEE